MISKEDLLKEINNCKEYEDYLRVVRKYIIHGTPYVFENNESEYYEFRSIIAKKMEYWIS